jgi:hypothetical protein
VSPLKTRILALIRRAGPCGIDVDDLFILTYADDRCPRGKGIREERSRTTLKAHVGQLNRELARRLAHRDLTLRRRSLLAEEIIIMTDRHDTKTDEHKATNAAANNVDNYDAERDTWAGAYEAYQIIRKRVSEGGKSWNQK